MTTKANLISTMASEAGISKAAANKVIKAFTGSVVKALKRGERVNLPRFGSFQVSKRNARIGRNPMTGVAIQIKARKVPRFKPGISLRKAVMASPGPHGPNDIPPNHRKQKDRK
jgi:DNA-binding protein HU-beta